MRLLFALILLLAIAGDQADAATAVAPIPPIAVAAPGDLPADALLVTDAELATLRKSAGKRRAEWERAERSGDTAGLAALLDPANGEHDRLRFEATVAAAIDRLRSRPPLTALEPMLERLASYRSRVYQRHPETAADYFVPVFAIETRAAGTLRLWRAERAAKRAPAPSDAEAYLAAIALADPATQLALVASAPRDLAYAEARAVLESDWADRSLAAVALTTLASWLPDDASVRARVFKALADPALGASAAAILAREPSRSRVDALGALLASSASPQLHANTLLALRLIGTAQALAVARDFLARADADSALRAEVAQW